MGLKDNNTFWCVLSFYTHHIRVVFLVRESEIENCLAALPALLVTKCHQRIDAGGAARRDVAGGQRNGAQYGGRRHENHQVRTAHPIQDSTTGERRGGEE